MEAAVGERTAEPFVEEQKQQRDLDAFRREAVGVAGSIALQQAMAFEFAQVVAQLVDAVASVGELEGGENGLMDLLGGPAADVAATVQEDLEQADDARIMELDAGVADRADGDGQGESLQQREVNMDVEPLRLEAGEAISDGQEPLAHGMEMIQSLPEMEIGEVVGDQLVAQVGGELFVLFEEGVLEIGTEDMVAVLDAVDDGGEFATHPAVHPGAEDCGDLVAGEPPQTEFAAAFEQFVDGKVPLEDEVAAVFDLGDRVEAREVEPGALLGGELRAQDQRPIVEPLADDLRAQPIGGGLQRGHVIHREKGVVGLAEADPRSVQLLLDEAVAIEVIRGLERQERGDPHDHRAEGFVADVEIVVGEAAALTRQDAVIGDPWWGILAR